MRLKAQALAVILSALAPLIETPSLAMDNEDHHIKQNPSKPLRALECEYLKKSLHTLYFEYHLYFLKKNLASLKSRSGDFLIDRKEFENGKIFEDIKAVEDLQFNFFKLIMLSEFSFPPNVKKEIVSTAILYTKNSSPHAPDGSPYKQALYKHVKEPYGAQYNWCAIQVKNRKRKHS